MKNPMKDIMHLLACLAVMVACQQPTQKTGEGAGTEPAEEPVAEASGMNFYGEKITGEGAVQAEELLAALEGKDSVKVKFSSKIRATCQVKGCWMKVNLADDSEIRVTFKDYGFFVPKEGMEGKETSIEGYAKQIETDVETLKHYAKDAGKSQEEIDAITSPKREIAFVASGVIIK